MAIRLFLFIGVALAGLAGYLIVIDQPAAVQMSPSVSQLAKFQIAGLVPGPNDMRENEEVEHGVFEVPAEDEVQLAKALANAASMPGMDMGGMNMPGMDMGAAAPADPQADPHAGMAMDTPPQDDVAASPTVDHSTMAMGGAEGSSMTMPADSPANMTTEAPKGGSQTPPPVDHSTMAMGDGGAMTMPTDTPAATTMEAPDGGTMSMPADGAAAVAVATPQSDAMAMPKNDTATSAVMGPSTGMPSDETLKMTMDTFGSAAPPPATGSETTTAMIAPGGGAMTMPAGDHGASGTAMDDMQMGKGGLMVREEGGFDREIDLVATEWGFSTLAIDVKMGERIRFNIRNGGQIPHEFMFMTMPAMSAVNYRAQRADWNLLEHEALFERSLLLPGGDFSIVVTIQQAGSWMFMCMLPYHMQLGMMGQMATPGMAMSM